MPGARSECVPLFRVAGQVTRRATRFVRLLPPPAGSLPPETSPRLQCRGTPAERQRDPRLAATCNGLFRCDCRVPCGSDHAISADDVTSPCCTRTVRGPERSRLQARTRSFFNGRAYSIHPFGEAFVGSVMLDAGQL
ncbi:hypothetical protein MRX96_045406 [Rhipicephalus microplus]